MIREEVRKILSRSISKILPSSKGADLILEHPQDKKFGDFTTNISMRLAKHLRRSPLEIGQDIARQVAGDKAAKKFISKVESVPPGFLNVYINTGLLEKELKKVKQKGRKYGQLKIGANKKLIVEHTSVNPNKAMHVGHLRNMAIGDSVAALMAAAGYKVEIENYIDDTGVQVADVVVALNHFKESPKPGQKFDHFCWDIYSRIQKEYETTPALLEEKTKVQHALEAGTGPIAEQARELVRKIISDQLKTTGRLNVFYDVFVFESSILGAGLWQKAFDQLKKSGKVDFETSGPNSGCWVFKNLALSPDEKLKNPDKILVTSKGVAVYTAKDIAYHLWKFGQTSGNFKYEKLGKQDNGQTLYGSSQKGNAKKFGRAKAVINVVDVRQSYPQLVVKSALKELGFFEESENLKHLSYEVVSLSPETAKALGADVHEGKGSYAMSGRKGIGVKADDLIDALSQKVRQKQQEGGDTEKGMASADAIAAAAMKAYMLKQGLNQEVVFDMDQALSLTGDSGPYLQYTHARIKGILRKAGRLARVLNGKAGSLQESEETDLLRKIYIFPEIVELAATQLAPHMVYHYLIGLAQSFNTFYSKHQVLKAEDKHVRAARLNLIQATAQVLENGLRLLGIHAPDRM